MRFVLWLGLASITVAILIGVHQFVKIGRFFEVKDAWHHEFLMALTGAFGFGILVGVYVSI